MPKAEVERLAHRVDVERARLIDPARIEAIEAVTRHDVIAFLTHVEEVCGIEARHLHLGMTSSDLLDTSLAVQLKRASDLLLGDLDRLLEVLKRRAYEHKLTVTMGRSHGIHAEPTTFGVKLAGFYAEFARNRARMASAQAEIATCAISGAVGTFANIDPRVEEAVASRLGLDARAGLDPGHPTGPACELRRDARGDRQLRREDRDGGPSPAAHGGR